MTIYRLYIKRHRKTNLLYFGQTKQDPYKYKGSGIDWVRHIEQFGNDVETTVIYETTSKAEMAEKGRIMSNILCITSAMDDYGNKIWANRINETGSGPGAPSGESHHFYGKKHSEEWKKQRSESQKRISSSMTADERRKKHGLCGEKNPFYGKRHTEEQITQMISNRRSYKGEDNPHFGKIHSKAALSKMKGPRPSVAGKNNPSYGKKWTSEEIQKRTETRKINRLKKLNQV